MKKALFIITVIVVILTSSAVSADPVVDGFFRATKTYDITNRVGIGPNGEMAGITELTVREFILMTTIHVLSQRYYEPSMEWEVLDNGTACFGFWAGVKEYQVCIKEESDTNYVAIDRVF
jgi:hypothetical protein